MKNCVELDRVWVQYRLQRERTLKGVVLHALGGAGRRPPLRQVTALRNVSVKVCPGERIGLIGPNGAGKTTLLKVMGGLLPPTQGHVRVPERTRCLLNTMSGFDPAADGWTNILLRSLALGVELREARRRSAEIAEFSELGDFLDAPICCYSRGMLTRLGFAVSTAFPAGALLLDEVLAAGDLAFRRKAMRRIEGLIDQATVLVLVSHSLETVSRTCDRVLWIERGEIALDGPPQEVCDAYRIRSRRTAH